MIVRIKKESTGTSELILENLSNNLNLELLYKTVDLGYPFCQYLHLTLFQTSRPFNDQEKKTFENTEGKREIAGKHFFSGSLILFSILWKSKAIISAMFNLSSANALNMEESIIY